MIKGILFDKDGTLIDFTKTYAPATREVINVLSDGDEELAQRMAAAVHFNINDMRFDPQSVVIAGTGRDIANAWLPALNNWNIDTLIAKVDKLYTDLTEKHVSPFVDLDATISSLRKRGIALGVATNDAEMSAHRHVERMGHAGSFQFVAGYDSGHGAKPGPGMVLAFAEAIGTEPEKTMMVGDSLHDLHAGRAAGAICVAVTTGMASADDLAPHADHVIGSLSELVGLLK